MVENFNIEKKSHGKRYYKYLVGDSGLKVSTIDSIHTVLHQILNMAVGVIIYETIRLLMC